MEESVKPTTLWPQSEGNVGYMASCHGFLMRTLSLGLGASWRLYLTCK